MLDAVRLLLHLFWAFSFLSCLSWHSSFVCLCCCCSFYLFSFVVRFWRKKHRKEEKKNVSAKAIAFIMCFFLMSFHVFSLFNMCLRFFLFTCPIASLSINRCLENEMRSTNMKTTNSFNLLRLGLKYKVELKLSLFAGQMCLWISQILLFFLFFFGQIHILLTVNFSFRESELMRTKHETKLVIFLVYSTLSSSFLLAPFILSFQFVCSYKLESSLCGRFVDI